MSDRVLRVIHVGAGGRGRWPLDVVGGDSAYESVALVDVNEEFLAAAREKTGLGESECFSDLAEAARSVEADLAIACTPTVTHAPFARIAFEAGLSVLVEKGMTLDWQLARELVAEADAAGVKFCVSQNYRYFPVEQTMKSILGTEKYGEPAFLDLIHHRHRPNPRTLDYKNAMIWDMSCHHYDNLVYWFGPARSVTARTFGAPWSLYAPHDANVSAVITFESGVNCTYSMSHVGQNGRHLTWIHTDEFPGRGGGRDPVGPARGAGYSDRPSRLHHRRCGTGHLGSQQPTDARSMRGDSALPRAKRLRRAGGVVRLGSATTSRSRLQPRRRWRPRLALRRAVWWTNLS